MKITLDEASRMRGEERYQSYGALDAAGTLEIFQILQGRLNDTSRAQYDWCRAQRSPAVCMTLRGIRVDVKGREEAVKELEREHGIFSEQIAAHPIIGEVWDGKQLETGWCSVERPEERTKKGVLKRPAGPQRHKWAPAATEAERHCLTCGCSRMKPKPFNPASPNDCKHLLYDLLKAPIQKSKEGNVTTDSDALEAIGRRKPKLFDLTQMLLTLRDLDKQLGTLAAQLSPLDRFHSSFHVGGAWTGRWSSSQDPFRRGGNLQNVTERHRYLFLPDQGRKMCYADLKTAESLIVAYMSGDENYIEAHKQDVHTYVCRLVWPDLPWTGDIKADKKIATSMQPDWDKVPGHDFRFQAKGVQHGSNYGLTPFGMAIMRHIPVKVAKEAQGSFFKSFPQILEWQKWTRARVQAGLPIQNPLGRSIRLFGRPNDERTFKQAYAFGPQSSVGDILNLGLYRLWHRHDPDLIECLAQVHDAVLAQFEAARQADALGAIKDALEIPIDITDFNGVTRTCTILVEAAVGDCWGKKNLDPKKGPIVPNGLVEVAI